MRTLNLGILAHVDAGKTSLTERLLFAAGVIDQIGRVDDGSTQTDTLALERQRGITIKAAVVSFVLDDVTVNLIDTPGHPDFIAEVDRALGVLDGAVLVISAVEGVQAQTRVLMRALRRLRIPVLIFVNKIDRSGAAQAGFQPSGGADTAFTTRLADLLAERDDALLAVYVADEAAVSYPRLRAGLAAQSRRALVHPVFFGSAITGAGISSLLAGLTVGLRVDPAPPGSGLSFRLAIELGALPLSFLRAVEDTVHATLRQGLRGWQVTDATVTLTHSGYYPRQSHAHAHFDKAMSSTGADFRGLTPLVLMSALRQAGTHVYEPVQRFRLEVPADLLGRVLPALSWLSAVPELPEIFGPACVIEGDIRTAQLRALEQQLPALTQGEGALECVFGRYQRVGGPAPSRPRSDHDPPNRQEYLRHVTR